MTAEIILRDKHHYLMEIHNNQRVETYAASTLKLKGYIEGDATEFLPYEIEYVKGYRLTEKGKQVLRELGLIP
ncbi:MAG: hypothetical protein JNL32_03610 [Candidatus Kapabacteria bacterium]|nr:hypothetical protein [Candidatus Kapabacteria bacterium]